METVNGEHEWSASEVQDQAAIRKDNLSCEEKARDGWSTNEVNTITRKLDLAIGLGDKQNADATTPKELAIGQKTPLSSLALGTT